jgi:hypothetical protein
MKFYKEIDGYIFYVEEYDYDEMLGLAITKHTHIEEEAKEIRVPFIKELLKENGYKNVKQYIKEL